MTKIVFSLLVAAFVVSSGCSKYPEGPDFTLLPKAIRLDGTWKVDRVVENGNDYTSAYRLVVTEESIEFTKDGSYEASFTYPFFGQVSEIGSWEWGDRKETIRVIVGSNTTESKIIRLADDELILESTDSIVVRTYMVPR